MKQPEPIRILAPESRRRALQEAITRRQLLNAGAVGMAGLYLAGCGGKSGSGGGSSSAKAAPSLQGKPIENKMLMANWVDYVDPKDVKAYHRALGPKVTIEGYGSNDELIAKLSAGGSAYDVIAPSGSYVPQMIEKNLLMKLDHGLIPNLKNLEPAFTKTKYDPGNKYSVTKNYGITSFYYRKDVVQDPPTTLAGWFEALPRYKGKTINLIEGGSEIWGVIMLAAGHHEDSTNEADYKDALKLALSVKPAITTNQLDLHRAARPGAHRHRRGLERGRAARRTRGEEEGHRHRLHRHPGHGRVLDGQLDDRRGGEEPGGRPQVDQLRPAAQGRRP